MTSRRITMAVYLADPQRSATVVDYLLGQPLRPRWRFELRPDRLPGNPYVDLVVLDRQHLGGADGWSSWSDATGRHVLLVDEVDRLMLDTILEGGNCGVIALDSSQADLRRAVEVACEGGVWLAPSVLKSLRAAGRHYQGDPSWTLTSREHDIWRLLVAGMSNSEIATALHLEVSTIRTHIRGILRKAGCANRHQLLAAAIHRTSSLGVRFTGPDRA